MYRSNQNYRQNQYQNQRDNTLQVFRLKKLFQKLENAKICGSVLTIVIPPKKSISEISSKLIDQAGKATNIKDKNNRQTVIEAQNSAREILKHYQKAPQNGLVLFCGRVVWEGSKTQKKFIYHFQPYKPVNFSIFSCDSSFDVLNLKKQLLTSQISYGFIIVDGQGALFAKVQGNSIQIIQKYQVQLPNNHNKGGQSAVRFARLRTQKRGNYLTKISEKAVESFITDNKCNVVGIIIAGNADLKNQLSNSQYLDQRLEKKVLSVVSISKRFQQGLNQAIQKSCSQINKSKYMQQKQSLCSFFQHINRNDNMVVYGVQETIKYLELGVINKLIIDQNLNIHRINLRNPQTGDIKTVYTRSENMSNPQFLRQGSTKLEIMQSQNQQSLLVQWIANHYKEFKCQFELISDKSPDGHQFVKGFGGLGGFLKYKVQIETHNQKEEDEFNETEDSQQFY